MAINVLIEHMGNGRIAQGFIDAIERCGRVLETHFPRSEASCDECRTAFTCYDTGRRPFSFDHATVVLAKRAQDAASKSKLCSAAPTKVCGSLAQWH